MPDISIDCPLPRWSLTQRIIRTVLGGVWRIFVRLHIDGLAHIPASGPFVLAMNHLHLFDSCLIFCFVPRPLIHLVHTNWQNWFVSYCYNAIYTPPQQDDAQTAGRAVSLMQALAAMRTGQGVLIAPEGRRSTTGGLERGRPGVACLATQGGVPVVPMVFYGQEKAMAVWKRLRRPTVCMRIGAPFTLPSGLADDARLQVYTDQVMHRLARMLPSEYRGVYADGLPRENDPAK